MRCTLPLASVQKLGGDFTRAPENISASLEMTFFNIK
jgi:hypothetical protein